MTEISFMDWARREAITQGVDHRTILWRFYNGQYPGMTRRHERRRGLRDEFFVQLPSPRWTGQPAPGEMCYKQWVYEEAERQGVEAHTVYTRVLRGKYKNLSLRKTSRQMVFVKLSSSPVYCGQPEKENARRIKDAAKRESVSVGAIYMRISRGKYPSPRP